MPQNVLLKKNVKFWWWPCANTGTVPPITNT